MISAKDFNQIIRHRTHAEQIDRQVASEECYELAKQVAIDFSNWGNSHRCSYSPKWGQSEWTDNEGETVSTEELFNLYLKSQE